MSDSFALGSTGNVVLTDSSTMSAPVQQQLTQVVGGTTNARFQNVTQSGDWIGQAGEYAKETKGIVEGVLKIAAPTAEKYIAQRQQAAYFDGMAKVAQGQALTDIEKEQPWYTKIFGPSATVRGAQAMTAMTVVQQQQADFLNSMPNLRAQSPDDVRKYLVNQAQAINVGDVDVNNAIQAKLAEGWGTMLEAHAKQHYAWMQDQNSRAWSGMQLSQGGYLQSVAGAGAGNFLSTDTGIKAKQQTLDQIDTNPGMDPDTFRRSTLSAVRANYERGNFIYGRIFRESQMWQNLSADEQRNVDQYQQKAEQQYLNKLAYSDYGTQKADIMSQASLGLISRNDAIKAAHRLNENVAQATGVEAPFVTGQDLETMVKGNNRAIIREMDKADARTNKANEAHQKELQKLQDTNFAVGQINAGDPEQAIITGAASKAEVEQLINAKFSEFSQQSPDQAVQFLAKTNSRGFVSDRVASLMTSGMRASQDQGYTDAFATSADWYRKLAAVSPAAADAYFGAQAPQMHQFVDMTAAGAQPQDAWKSTFSKPPQMNNIMRITGGRQQAADAVTKAVDSAWRDGGVMAALGFREDTAPYLMRNLTTAVTNRIDQYVGANADINQAALVATKNAGVDQFGRDGYVKAPGQMTIARTLNIPDDAMGDVFSGIRDTKLKAIGANPNQINSIIRSGNNLYISLITDDGITHTVPVSADEMKSAYASGIKKRDNRKRPMSTNANLLSPQGAAFIGM